MTKKEINDRKQTEEELRKSERELRYIFNNMQDVFYRTDKEGRIIWVSPSVTEMLGYKSPDELIGVDLSSEVYANPHERQVFLQKLSVDGKVTDYEVELKKSDGSIIVGSTSSQYYYDINGEISGVEGVCRDITKRKEAEKEREELICELENALKEIKTLRGIVPICSFCKQIRDDRGFWNQVEAYISDHTNAEFSHVYCPKCAKKNYPDLFDEDEE